MPNFYKLPERMLSSDERQKMAEDEKIIIATRQQVFEGLRDAIETFEELAGEKDDLSD